MGALFEGVKEMMKSLPWKTWLVIFVIGVLFGWFVLGWGIAPVKWVNAAPQHLEPSWRADYLRMVIESFTANGNVELARVRYQGLGPEADKVLQQVEQDPGYLNPADIARFKAVVVAPMAAGGGASATQTGAAAAKSPFGWLGLCLVILVGLLALGAILFLGKKMASKGQGQTAREAVQPLIAEGGPAPISSYRTTYTLGDDYFDESFSIDTASGEFLGEAGLSISEATEGQPKYVKAFEVWLFDKADIRTETAILCTPEAYQDEETRQRLEAKGAVMVASPGQKLILETEKLQLEAHIVECEFDTGPDGQYFQRLTVEFRVYQRLATDGGSTAHEEGGLSA
ncbi:MAG: hypothetical protein GXO37_00095 [Chloroflexi bacterium]|nr:hypothetical protein [Chloroflexota bacterium]